MEFHASGSDLGDVEEIVDDLEQIVGALSDVLDLRFLLLRERPINAVEEKT
jgi:hypothetical protein